MTDTLIILDSHNDTMCKVINQDTGKPENNIGNDTDFHIDRKKLEKGGLNAAFYAAFTVYHGEGEEKTLRTGSRILSLLNAMYCTEKMNSDFFKVAKTYDEVMDAVKTGRHAMIPAIEGAYSLEEYNYRGLLRQYADLGVSYISLVWNHENSLGTGTAGPSDRGLTELGEKVIREMNRLGILVDVSHMNEKTFWDALKASEAPVFASHSGTSALVDHVRNMKDEQIKALNEKGGTVNVNYWVGLLAEEGRQASVKDIADQIDHIVKISGYDHAGLGSDFDGAKIPDDIKDASGTALVIEELEKRGYSEENIRKIAGLNTLRVLKTSEEKSEGKDFTGKDIICFENEMGDEIKGKRPEISCNLKEDIHDIRVILDGVYTGSGIKKTGIELRFIPDYDLLDDIYHVITFEGLNDHEKEIRNTLIFRSVR